jgi:hypothetical protein
MQLYITWLGMNSLIRHTRLAKRPRLKIIGWKVLKSQINLRSPPKYMEGGSILFCPYESMQFSHLLVKSIPPLLNNS